MEFTSLCAIMATLRVVPNRSQFFQYESVSLICGQRGNVSGWRLLSNTSISIKTAWSPSWNGNDASTYSITDLYPSDSGVYWCECAAGQRSNSVSINVTAGSVILDSPALPVLEGEAVTLRCSDRTASSSTCSFYKDELPMATSSTGNLTILSVSASDAGLYKCSVSGAGESPSSWLQVRGRPEPPRPTFTLILLPVGFKCILLISLIVSCLWRKHKESRSRFSSSLCSVAAHRPVTRMHTYETKHGSDHGFVCGRERMELGGAAGHHRLKMCDYGLHEQTRMMER